MEVYWLIYHTIMNLVTVFSGRKVKDRKREEKKEEREEARALNILFQSVSKTEENTRRDSI